MESKIEGETHISDKPFPIVAIGASAGGMSPLERFLSALPKKFGFALVFMQHLSPRHRSLLPELLRSKAKGLEVEEIWDGLNVHPGILYVCPPAQEVRLQAGIFRVASRSRAHIHLPIDELLVSLSEDAPERTIAVIFSGAGTDGARGVQAVRAKGGTVFVQDPASAEYPDMPLAAINTGHIDGVLSPEDIAEEILKLYASGMANLSADDLMAPAHFDSLYRVISERTGYLFSHYKRNVVARRVRRRMYLHGVSSVDAYLNLLAKKDQEASQLVSDLLIGVTSFFRDRLAWKALHLEVTRKLIAGEDESPIRVWTPGCATGEEAYSVAMLLQYELDLAGKKREIQVFATDVNDRALERAREGTYPPTIAADLPPEYLQKFFTRGDDGLSVTVNKEIRQQVVFAKQNLLTDPPFSRLDLVICRNLLIYLDPEAQEKCIALFHYALNQGGYLFLGNAESPGRGNALFASLAHKKCRIYRKGESGRSMRMPLSIPFAAERSAPTQRPAPEHRPSITQFIQEALLEEHAPVAVAINQNHEILYHNGPTNRYLRQPRGTPTQNLLELIPKKLRNRMRGALYRAAHEQEPVTIRTSIITDERKKQLFIRISTLQENLFLITFREKGASPEEPDAFSSETAAIETVVRQLESELSATRDDLQSYIEELKSVNEELESSNEELQAANEELEASRDERQSLNEELTTVNAQLQVKIEEQEETNNDLSNFLTSTNIPTIFLDDRFRVKRFTPAMSKLISLIPADEGRSIMDMSRENLGPGLLAEARSVLDSLVPIRKELSINDASYVRTILPYRTGDNRIEGVVITYADFTERKLAEDRILRAKEEWERTFDSVPDMIAILDNEHRIRRVNKAMARRLGVKPEQCIGLRCYEAVHGTSAPPQFCPHAMTIKDGTEHVEEVHESRLGGDFVVSTTPMYDDQGRMVGAVHVAHDITDRKRAEERIRHLASFPEINPNPVLEVDAEGVVTFCNASAQAALERAGLEEKRVTALLPADMDALLGGWDRQTDVIVNREITIGDRVFDEAIHLVSGFNVARIYAHDITERKRHENRIASLTGLYAVLSRVNETIVRVRDEQPLLQEVCATVAELGGFPLVWIGLAKEGLVAPVASCGQESGYLRNIRVEVEGKLGRGPTGTCVREDRPVINDDFSTNSATAPWREQALLHGFHASAAFPVRRQGKAVGALTIYANDPGAFDAEQVGLLESLSADISYALDAMEQERLRIRTEEALRKAYDELEKRVEERTQEVQDAYDRLMTETREREQAEHQLRQAQKIEALGTLTGGIAHDFNNILAAIIGFTEIVRDRIAKEGRDKRHLDRVMEASLRGRELIKRMLAFSRKTEQEKKPVLLSSIVTETMKFVRSSTPTTISIRVDVKSESGMVFADPVQMQQVLLNLCTNAAQAMQGKGGILDVELSDWTVDESDGSPSGMKPGPYVKLVIRDTGTGISPDIIHRIFDPFFTTKKVGEGTGLGLSVVHGIVHQHDGYITVESEEGKRTTFTVCLPMVAGERPGDAVTDPVIPRGTERVLFVDDEELLAEMGQEMLEDLGYEVKVTTSSSEALALFRSDPGRFDLVITDVTMPDITGVELAGELLGIRADIPIIMCTGFSYLVDPDAAKAAGIKAFTMKPLSKKEIAGIIRKVLDG